MITDVFDYNQHFVAMMNIINNARINPPNRGHKHHIIPKCWFKAHNLEIDNSPTNLVKLTYEKHLKVHLLASYCIKTDNMKLKMKQAHNFLLLKGDTRMKTGTSWNKGKHLSEEIRRKISKSNTGKHLSEETKRKISEVQKGRISNRKGVKLSEETRRKIGESHKGMKFSQEARRKMSEAKKGKIPNNLEILHKLNKGRKFSKAQRAEMLWFNNGKINIRSSTCPDGFIKGRYKHSKQKEN